MTVFQVPLSPVGVEKKVPLSWSVVRRPSKFNVLAPYGTTDSALGLLGVLGPTRMPYPRAIPTVRYLSTLMNELITNQPTENHD